MRWLLCLYWRRRRRIFHALNTVVDVFIQSRVIPQVMVKNLGTQRPVLAWRQPGFKVDNVLVVARRAYSNKTWCINAHRALLPFAFHHAAILYGSRRKSCPMVISTMPPAPSPILDARMGRYCSSVFLVKPVRRPLDENA